MDKAIRDKYQAIIGLEVHAQLLTESKAYSSDSTEYGVMPNTKQKCARPVIQCHQLKFGKNVSQKSTHPLLMLGPQLNRALQS